MKMTKRVLSVFLVLVLCLACVPAGLTGSAAVSYSKAVYTIFTNPGEDCNTQMRIGWHSDADNTECYVMYTTADDTEFENAIRVEGTYDDQAYKWFYNRLTTNALSDSRYTNIFLDWGVELKHLTPATDYIYRVYDGEGLYSKTYKFKTAGADEYSIIWMSDPHVNNAFPGRLVDWRKMVTFAGQKAKYPVGFQFSTGDTLACGDRYADWLSIANEAFSRNYMIANVVGNHDVYDAAMYADTPNYTQYWKGGEYFRIAYNNPTNGYTYNSARINGYLTTDGLTQYADRPSNEQIVYSEDGKYCTGAVDNTDGRCYWFNYNGILFIIFEYYSMMVGSDTEAALEWAGNVIKQNEGKYDYIICANHVNLVNGGGGDWRDYGATDYDYFGKFFDEYNVDIFLAGDNHVYLRTDSIYNGAVNSDPQKGTYIVQAPCISRPQANITTTSGSGFAVNQYSLAGKTLGGLVIDVDESGMTFSCLTMEADRYPQYDIYESFTIPRKTREKNEIDLKADAAYTVVGDLISVEEGTTAQDVIACFANASVVVKDENGNEVEATAELKNGYTVTVSNDGFAYPAAVLTVSLPTADNVLLGDVNEDGEVNNIDAATALKFDAGLYALTDEQMIAGDVNKDGEVNNIDAALILKFDAGIIEEF